MNTLSSNNILYVMQNFHADIQKLRQWEMKKIYIKRSSS